MFHKMKNKKVMSEEISKWIFLSLFATLELLQETSGEWVETQWKFNEILLKFQYIF